VEWTITYHGISASRAVTSARVGGWGFSAAAASYSAEAGGEAAAWGKLMCPVHKLLLSAEPWIPI